MRISLDTTFKISTPKMNCKIYPRDFLVWSIYNKALNGILRSSISNNYHEVTNVFGSKTKFRQTCRRDNHDVTNTISQTSSAVSIIIVGLHNIEDMGLTIAYYKSDILSEFIKLYYVSDIIVGLSYLYRTPKPSFQKCNTILTNNSTFVGFRVELSTTIHTYFCVSHYISIPFEIMLMSIG